MKGDERNWWSEETLKAFKRKTECLKDQYSNFTFDGGTVGFFLFVFRAAVYRAQESLLKLKYHFTPQIDGEKTLSENIADNGGVKQAFRVTSEPSIPIRNREITFNRLSFQQTIFPLFCKKIYLTKIIINLIKSVDDYCV